MPESILIVEDFPAPFGPIKPTISPFSIVKLRSFTAFLISNKHVGNHSGNAGTSFVYLKFLGDVFYFDKTQFSFLPGLRLFILSARSALRTETDLIFEVAQILSNTSFDET